MTAAARLLRCGPLFSGFSEKALADVAGTMEARTFRAGEPIYREGERQHWLGVLESGTASVHVALGASDQTSAEQPLAMRAGNHITDIPEGGIFGELAALGIREQRTSTATAASTECRVLVLEADALAGALQAHPDEEVLLSRAADRWRAFLGSRLAAQCHPELAYQLRRSAAAHVLGPGEHVTLGACGAEPGAPTGGGPSLSGSTAVVECGRATSAAEHVEVYGPGAAICDEAVLGVKGVATVVAGDKPCHLALVSRGAFWTLAARFAREREAFMKLALDRLPLVTFDVFSCQMLAYLQGSPGFWRVVQSSVRQRVVHPGADVCSKGEEGGVLTFFQEGLAEVVIGGRRVRQLATGDSCNELGFIGAVGRRGATVRALELCVLQELRRADIEYHLTRHHTIRACFRELTRLRPHFKRDLSIADQVRLLEGVSFFAGLPHPFLEDINGLFEDRIFLPGQAILRAAEAGEVMALLLDGAARRGSGDRIRPGRSPEVVGEIGMICSCTEQREDLVATEICCAKMLHRSLFLDCLQRYSDVKWHFEAIAKGHMQDSSTGQEPMSNIYTLPFFRGCDSRFIYKLDLHLDRHVFFSGEVIVEEDTEGEDMYILYSGCMQAHSRGMTVGTLKGGQCFGEMAVLGLVRKRTATVVARSLCDVRILSKKLFDDIMTEFPEERARFNSLAATRHNVSHEKCIGGRIKSVCRFFEDCSPEFAEALGDLTDHRLFMEGEVLMREGEKGDWIALLHQGSAAVSSGGERVDILGGGDIAGEVGALGLSPTRTATVTALETCFVQVLHSLQLRPALERFPEERRRLRARAARRLERRRGGPSARQIDLFRGSPRPFLDFVDSQTQRWVFFQGDFLMREGTPGRQLLMIFGGAAEVIREGAVVGTLERGDVLGELCCLGVVERRTASARCTEVCDVYSLSWHCLAGALRRWPEQLWPLRAVAAKRMRRDIDRSTDKSFLQRCQLFEQCSAKFIQCISTHLEDRLFLPGEELCREGENGDTMFILMQGTLSVLLKEQEVNELHQGSIIGEIAVLGLSGARTATLRAKEACLVAVLCRPIFMKYLAEFPREMIQFQEVGAARLARMPIGESDQLYRRQVLFRDSGSAFMDSLCQRLIRKFVFAGQKIVKEGAESNEMYAICRGRASIERQGIRVGEVQDRSSFGEMAVLGIATTLTLTVRAETLCDMQVLCRWDLDCLLGDFPGERKKLINAAAQIAREGLTSATDLEILADVPMLKRLGLEALRRLSAAARVGLSCRGEGVLSSGESALIVILQGSASVEVGGVAVRELSAGDSFGEASLLGLAAAGSSCSLSALSTCLSLQLPRAGVLEAVEGADAAAASQWRLLGDELACGPGPPRALLSRFQAIQHLALREDQLSEMCGECEEAVFMPQQEILSPHMSAHVLLLILSGKAQAGRGRDSVLLEQGSSIGKVLAEPVVDVVGQSITAVEPCRALMFHQKSLARLVRGWTTADREGLLARMQTLPGRHCTESCLLGLRHRTDALAEKLLKAVRGSLQMGTVAWSAQKARGGARTGRASRPGVAALRSTKGLRDRIDQDDSAGDGAVRGGRPSATLLESRRRTSLSLQPEAPKPKPLSTVRGSPEPPRRAHRPGPLEQQEALLCLHLRRLLGEARHAAGEARQDEARLKGIAAQLRASFAAASAAAERRGQSQQPRPPQPGEESPFEESDVFSGSEADDRGGGREPSGYWGGCHAHSEAEAARMRGPRCEELEALRRSKDAAGHRINALRADLERACCTRSALLGRLAPCPRAAAV